MFIKKDHLSWSATLYIGRKFLLKLKDRIKKYRKL